MLDKTALGIISAKVHTFIEKAMPNRRGDIEFFEDLRQETVVVVLEGKAVDYYFAVQKAARNIGYKNECDEFTGHKFSVDEGSAPSGRRNTEDDYVEQLEIDDWVDSRLSDDQKFIAQQLTKGFTQSEIALEVGVSQQAISLAIKSIRKIVEADFDVNKKL